MKAIHGFQVYEIRNGQRIRHFHPNSQYATAKCRILDLARDRRCSLSVREFQIWDGITPITKITVKEKNIYSERPFYAEENFREKMGRDADIRHEKRSMLKNQRVGMAPADMNSWIKSGHSDKVYSKKELQFAPSTVSHCVKENYVAGTKMTKRSLNLGE